MCGIVGLFCSSPETSSCGRRCSRRCSAQTSDRGPGSAGRRPRLPRSRAGMWTKLTLYSSDPAFDWSVVGGELLGRARPPRGRARGGRGDGGRGLGPLALRRRAGDERGARSRSTRRWACRSTSSTASGSTSSAGTSGAWATRGWRPRAGSPQRRSTRSRLVRPVPCSTTAHCPITTASGNELRREACSDRDAAPRWRRHT